MDKKKFQEPEIEVIKFDERDVITESEPFKVQGVFDINDVNGMKDNP